MSKSKFGIVTKIMAIFNLGEAGKLESFFSKLEKDFQREIKANRHNLSALKMQHENNVDQLNEKIEDAQAAVENAWNNIDPKELETHASQDSFKGDYLARINSAESKVTRLMEELARLEESYKESVEAIEATISKYEARLARLDNK